MLQADKLIRDQAILRHKEQNARRKTDTQLPQGPGNTSVGSIYDCNRKHFERMIRTYWDRLYVGWNPFKKDGIGCWEVWARPSKKTLVLHYEDSSGLKISTLEYKPNDFEHWVADLDCLSYSFIDKLREMDGWENKHQIAQHDEKYEQHLDKLEHNEEEHLRYVVRHNKSAFKDLLEYTQQGYNPLQFFTKK